MEITIQGPNLSREAEAKGSMHVHAAGCADNGKYGQGRRYGGEDRAWTIEVADRREAVLDIYGDQIAEGCPYDAAEGDIYFAPCVEALA